MHRRAVFGLAFLLLAAGSAAHPEEVVELWRSPFGEVRWVSVNHTDGSCWVAAGCSVMHLAADGTILSHLGGFAAPEFVSVNSRDGSCWVAASGDVIHLARDGRELLRVAGFDTVSALSVNSTDGSCWVGRSSAKADERLSEVVHLAQDGRELLRVGGLYPIYALSVNPADGSCWVGHGWAYWVRPFSPKRSERDPQQVLTPQYTYYEAEVLHLSEDGAELWRGEDFDLPDSLSVNPVDGSCWVTDPGCVVHLAEDGTELWRSTDSRHPDVVSVNPADGTCWAAGRQASGALVWRLAVDGTELARFEGSGHPISLSADPRDGSCWVGYVSSNSGSGVIHLAGDGAELWSGAGFASPRSLLVNPADGSCWVAHSVRGGGVPYGVCHLAEDGGLLWERSFGPEIGARLHVQAVDPADRSVWVTAYFGDVIHLAEDGTELLWVEGVDGGGGFALNPADGSVWVTGGDGDVIHLSRAGAELLRVGGFHARSVLEVNPLDGSCWVAYPVGDDDGPYGVCHLAEDGEELLRLEGYDAVGGPSVNAVDGSCWLTQSHWDGDTGTWRGEVLHLDQDGAELLRLEGFGRLGAPSVVGGDGSCWVLESQWYREDGEFEHEAVHLAQNGDELARVWESRTEWEMWYFPRLWANPVDSSCWVYLSYELSGGRYRGELVYLAGDGSEIWRGAGFQRLVALSVNPADGSCWVADEEAGQVVHLAPLSSFLFPDLGFYHWAHGAVEACVEAAIVSGYSDGLYRPDRHVTRDQMAVYIARALASGEENIPEGPRSCSFLDVHRDHWAFDHIEYCLDNGVAAGYGLGLYHPDYEVSRAQMAVYIARALVAPAGDAGLADYVPKPRDFPFPDVPTDHWAYIHIEYCVEHGVVSGYVDGLYHPETVVTRDQMAVYMARAFGLLS